MTPASEPYAEDRMPVTDPPPASRSRSTGGPTGFADWDLPTAMRHVEQGLAPATLDHLQEAFALSSRELAEALLLSPRTLSRRRRSSDPLPPDESERAYRLGRLAEVAAHVLGGAEAARAWMREPNYALGEAIPLAVARTEPGARLVERLLGQIEHGITV